ncbi:hypothetical protein DYU11_19890 [Fibrisoma montanum]|uniref:Uncharacterized protein n=1 Tax=Fibrisoma montanum TaxID=2305895 RepID=A0A418M3B4_9BACT|nr:hypothetical protein [Fibrisoma montanum]RIV20315.1 hypothetical protein DYU11_19890 [Fibrisoma montanum]
MIAPDGSKEGWHESDYCDKARHELIRFIKNRKLYVDYVEVAFGGDDKGADLTAFNEEEVDDD